MFLFLNPYSPSHTFCLALITLDEFKQAAEAFPVLANMTEFGKTPYTGWKEFETVGCQAVIFPVTLFRTALGAMDRALDTIQEKGHQGSLSDEMMHRKDFYELIDYDQQEKDFDEKRSH